MTICEGNVLNYTFFSYFIGLPNRNSLINIEIHMRSPKAAKKESGSISISLEVVEMAEHLIVLWNNYVRYS